MRWEMKSQEDRGAALVGYALTVLLVAVASVTAMKTVGASTSEGFETVATTMAGTLEQQPELTPEEKWEQAKEDWRNALKDARDQRRQDFAEGRAEGSEPAGSQGLPKGEERRQRHIQIFRQLSPG